MATAVSAAVSAIIPVSLPGRGIPQENIFIEAGNGKQLALEAMEKLTPGAGPAAPRVTFAVRSFDPENDMLLPADAAALEDMASWQLQILDRKGDKVEFIQGQGQPPSPMLSWSGLNRNGEAFPGGFYTARFVWMDHAKNVYATRKVAFDLFAPLKMPKFAELKLDLGFTDGLSLL